MEVLILGICPEIFFLEKKRSKVRVHIIHGCALYKGKYSNFKLKHLATDNMTLYG